MVHRCKHSLSLTRKTTKPLLLIFPFSLLSHYLRCLTLASHFRPYFEIRFAHSEKYIDFIRKEGYQTFDCQSIHAEKVLECVKRFDFSWINEHALETVYLDQVKIINILKPAAVLGDTSLTLKMAAEKTGLTYISLMNGYMSKYYSYTRKISRTHPLYSLINRLPNRVANIITQKGEAITFQKVHKPFKKLRVKYKLSKKKIYPDELEGDINLICDLPDLFPQKGLPLNYIMVPPLYHETNKLYNEVNNKLDKRKKAIFVSMGSSGEWKHVLFLNNEHFKKYNIIAAGDNINILNAAHIIKTSFINIHEIFHFTDLVICQGGNGTIYQALLYGIPLLCKTNHFEQEWNVEALERLHAGRSLDEITRISDYIKIVDEWVAKKETGMNEFLKLKINEEVEKMGRIIGKVAVSITLPGTVLQNRNCINSSL